MPKTRISRRYGRRFVFRHFRPGPRGTAIAHIHGARVTLRTHVGRYTTAAERLDHKQWMFERNRRRLGIMPAPYPYRPRFAEFMH